eukprot:7193839-Karenia_brevis.AAC.1
MVLAQWDTQRVSGAQCSASSMKYQQGVGCYLLAMSSRPEPIQSHIKVRVQGSGFRIQGYKVYGQLSVRLHGDHT